MQSGRNCPWHSSCRFGSVCRVEFCIGCSVAALFIISPAISAAATTETVTEHVVDAIATESAYASFSSAHTFANY